VSFRFLGFPVYKSIKQYIKAIYEVTAGFPKEEQFAIVNQIRRAAVSVALNLAEGSDRGSDKEFQRFIGLSIGSLNETVAVLDISLDIGFINQQNYDIIISKAEDIIKQLSGLRKSLR